MNEQGMKLIKRAMILDFVCIAIALIVLYTAHKGILPYWGLITGALLALAFMVAALYTYIKGRKILRAEREQAIQELENTPEE